MDYAEEQIIINFDTASIYNLLVNISLDFCG